MTTELESLSEEKESARTLGVLDVDWYEERFHTKEYDIYTNIMTYQMREGVCASSLRTYQWYVRAVSGRACTYQYM